MWDSEHQGAACGESFHCENSDVCIDPSHVCNFHTDCPLGEDEGFICGKVLIVLIHSQVVEWEAASMEVLTLNFSG